MDSLGKHCRIERLAIPQDDFGREIYELVQALEKNKKAKAELRN